jgi:hypothetical protein
MRSLLSNFFLEKKSKNEIKMEKMDKIDGAKIIFTKSIELIIYFANVFWVLININ